MSRIFPRSHERERVVGWSIRSLTLAATLVFVGTDGFAADQKFDFEALRAPARARAAKPAEPPRGEVPAWLRALSYDDWRLIEFGGANSLGFEEKVPFQVQYLHPGF